MIGRISVWPAIVFALIALNLAIVGITIGLAVNDPGFAVEPEYDQRAMHWDEFVLKQRQSDLLEWSSHVRIISDGLGSNTLVVELRDRHEAPVSGASVAVEAFASRRAGHRKRYALQESGTGSYTSVIDVTPGMWHFEITADIGSSHYASRAQHIVSIPIGARP